MKDRINVLTLQPFYGGSHKAFHDGWVANSQHNWTTMTLPGRHWKWRMRHSSIYFTEQIQKQLAAQDPDADFPWDVVVCTDMLNLAELKGMLRLPARTPTMIYFHENQFVYPNRFDDPRDDHFRFTNFTSALASDCNWFNSLFNLESMLDELTKKMSRWPDFRPSTAIETIRNKSSIHSPGIELPQIDLEDFAGRRKSRRDSGDPVRIVWAARWEHDKRPDLLLDTLRKLKQTSLDFKISVVGQSFQRIPEPFSQIENEFGEQILRFGYQDSREDYWIALAEADLFLSTADHEFFGLSTAEAIIAGLHPVLPNRLSYPGLLSLSDPSGQSSYENTPDSNSEFLAERLYNDIDDAVRLIWNFAKKRNRTPDLFELQTSQRLQSNVSWPIRAAEMDKSLTQILAECRT